MPALRVWESHDGPLPTVEGCVDGITYRGFDDLGRTIITAQCSTCHRTYTDLMILALRAVSFARQGEFGGAEPFRRCGECRKGGREPANADKLRHVQRHRNAGRYTLRNADRWREVEQASLRAKGQHRGRLEVKLRNMLLACDVESEKKAEEAWTTKTERLSESEGR